MEGKTMELNLIEVSSADFETMEETPMVAVTTDAMQKTRSIVGTELQGPGAGVLVNINIKKDRKGGILAFALGRKENGKAVKVAIDGSENCYAFADVTITEVPTTITKLVVTTAKEGKYKGRLVRGKHVRSKKTGESKFYPGLNQFSFYPLTGKEFSGYIKLEGFRISVYHKEEGIQITTNMPSVLGASCPECGSSDIETSVYGDTKVWTCGDGHMGEGELESRFVDKYSGLEGTIARRIVPAIEYKFLLESGLEPNRRAFSAECSACSKMLCMLGDHNMSEPSCSCMLGVRTTVDYEDDWTHKFKHLVQHPSGKFMGLGSEAHQAPGLEGAPRILTHDIKGKLIERVPVQARKFTRKGWVNTVPMVTEHTVVMRDGTIKFTTVVGGPTIRTAAQYAAMSQDVRGRAAYEVPGGCNPIRLAEAYDVFSRALSFDTGIPIGTQYTQEGREKEGDMFGDFIDNVRFRLLMEQITDQTSVSTSMMRYNVQTDFNDDGESVRVGGATYAPVEDDAIPDMDDVRTILSMTHPLFLELILEKGQDKETYNEFPTVMRDMASLILAENNPTGIYMGDSISLMQDDWSDDACLWFSYESGKQAYGVAGFAAREVRGKARTSAFFAQRDEERKSKAAELKAERASKMENVTRVVTAPTLDTRVFDYYPHNGYTVIGGMSVAIPFGCTVDSLGNIVR